MALNVFTETVPGVVNRVTRGSLNLGPEGRRCRLNIPLEDDSEVYRSHVDPRNMCDPNAYASEAENWKYPVVES